MMSMLSHHPVIQHHSSQNKFSFWIFQGCWDVGRVPESLGNTTDEMKITVRGGEQRGRADGPTLGCRGVRFAQFAQCAHSCVKKKNHSDMKSLTTDAAPHPLQGPSHSRGVATEVGVLLQHP